MWSERRAENKPFTSAFTCRYSSTRVQTYTYRRLHRRYRRTNDQHLRPPLLKQPQKHHQPAQSLTAFVPYCYCGYDEHAQTADINPPIVRVRFWLFSTRKYCRSAYRTICFVPYVGNCYGVCLGKSHRVFQLLHFIRHTVCYRDIRYCSVAFTHLYVMVFLRSINFFRIKWYAFYRPSYINSAYKSVFPKSHNYLRRCVSTLAILIITPYTHQKQPNQHDCFTFSYRLYYAEIKTTTVDLIK